MLFFIIIVVVVGIYQVYSLLEIIIYYVGCSCCGYIVDIRLDVDTGGIGRLCQTTSTSANMVIPEKKDGKSLSKQGRKLYTYILHSTYYTRYGLQKSV